jgi:multicomponent Na+:H+ antiporter subunit G
MSHPIAVTILLITGVAGAIFSALGILLTDDFYERLHYMSSVASLSAIAIPAAVFVNELFSQAGIKALVIAALILVMNPAVTHATARAGRVRHFERWTIRPEELRPSGAPPETQEHQQ